MGEWDTPDLLWFVASDLSFNTSANTRFPIRHQFLAWTPSSLHTDFLASKDRLNFLVHLIPSRSTTPVIRHKESPTGFQTMTYDRYDLPCFGHIWPEGPMVDDVVIPSPRVVSTSIAQNAASKDNHQSCHYTCVPGILPAGVIVWHGRPCIRCEEGWCIQSQHFYTFLINWHSSSASVCFIPWLKPLWNSSLMGDDAVVNMHTCVPLLARNVPWFTFTNLSFDFYAVPRFARPRDSAHFSSLQA